MANTPLDETQLRANYADKLCAAHKTILSRIGKPSPLFEGREEEVSAVREALLKKRMRNLVLIGDPGIGKTEIMKKAIDGLETGDVFLNLDLASMISGCTLVGMFEERFGNIVHEISTFNRRRKQHICLYIDEIHNLFRVGKSDAYGTMSGGEILKPYLAEGSITVIGATTRDEYERYIKADKALLRRLPPLFIGGTDDSRTLKIVRGFAKREMDAETAAYVVERSKDVSYLNNPDCSLEIADRAMARAESQGRKATKDDVDVVVSFMVEQGYN